MKKITMLFILLVISSPLLANDITVKGVIGLSPVMSSSGIAVYIPLSRGEAVAGVEWFNNDSTVCISKIMVSAGTLDDPGTIDDAIVVQENVYGGNLDWSTSVWGNSFSGDSNGIYIFYIFSNSSEFVQLGIGGGTALGYCLSESGCAGWQSLEGQNWVAVNERYNIAIVPTLVDKNSDTIVLETSSKSNGEYAGANQGNGSQIIVPTKLFNPFPNPFNPQTEILFSLSDSKVVDISVYDVHGKLVKRLANQLFSAGEHKLTWVGVDNNGKQASSGLYLIKMKSENYVETHQVTLLK